MQSIPEDLSAFIDWVEKGMLPESFPEDAARTFKTYFDFLIKEIVIAEEPKEGAKEATDGPAEGASGTERDAPSMTRGARKAPRRTRMT